MYSDYDLWKLGYYADTEAQELADEEADAELDFESQHRELLSHGHSIREN